MEIFNCKETKEKRRALRKKLTEAEKALWEKLRGKRLEGLKFFRQYTGLEHILLTSIALNESLLLKLTADGTFQRTARITMRKENNT